MNIAQWQATFRTCPDCGARYQPTSGAQKRCLGCRLGRTRVVLDLPTKAAADLARAAERFGVGLGEAVARLAADWLSRDGLAAAEREAIEKGWIREEQTNG